MPTPINLYEQICTLSQHMVTAARANDWPGLVELERRVATLRDELISNGAAFSPSTPELLHKHGLIQQILKDDAEIRRHTEPWMERISQYLGVQNRPTAPPVPATDCNEMVSGDIST